MKITHSFVACVILLAAAFAPGQDALTNGLVGYFPFNGNANDESGNGHHAVAIGAGTTLTNGVKGQPNSAYRCVFPGGENYLEGSGINLSNSSLTVTLWFKKDYSDFGLEHGALVRAGVVGPSGGQTGKQLHVGLPTGSSLRFSFFYDDFDVQAAVGNGKWSHIACTFDIGTMERRIYIDGQLVATNIAVRSFTGPSTYFDFTPAGGAPAGMIDQVRFYNRALSDGEITTIHAMELGPRIGLIKAVKPTLFGLELGTNYQLQVSGDAVTWTNHGETFAATNHSMLWPEYWHVADWDRLYFRLLVNE